MKRYNYTAEFRRVVRKHRCVLAVDGSSTIPEKYFNGTLKKYLAMICTALSGVPTEIVLYAGGIQHVCGSTKEFDVLMRAIDAMKPLRSTKATAYALSQCSRLLGEKTKSNKRKTLILTSDGMISDLHAATKEIMNLEEKGVTVIVLGVGQKIDRNKLLPLCSRNLCFLLDDLDNQTAISKLFRTLQQTPDKENPLLDIEYRFSKSCHDNQPVEILLRLTNPKFDYNIPEGTELIFHTNQYFRKETIRTEVPITPKNSIETKVTLRPLPNVNGIDFCGTILVECVMGNLKQQYNLEIPLGIFRALFEKHLFGIPVNLIVLGPKGAGKSGLLNCFVAALTKDKVPYDAATCAVRVDHVTLAFNRIDINNFLDKEVGRVRGEPTIPLYLYDTWGMSEEDYQKFSYEFFLQGFVPPGTTREQLNNRRIDELQNMKCDKKHVIHAVLAVIPLGATAEESSLKKFNQLLKQCIDAGYSPIVVVTKIDLFKPETRPNEVKKLLSYLSLDERNVFFHRNYTGTSKTQFKRDTEIDMNARKILLAVWKRANEFKSTKGRQFFPSSKTWADDFSLTVSNEKRGVLATFRVDSFSSLSVRKVISDALLFAKIPTTLKFTIQRRRHSESQLISFPDCDLWASEFFTDADSIFLQPLQNDTQTSPTTFFFYKDEEWWAEQFQPDLTENDFF